MYATFSESVAAEFVYVTITIVEGVKKAACLLTTGDAAIAIPGVNAGYRTPTDEYSRSFSKIQHFLSAPAESGLPTPKTMFLYNTVLGVSRLRFTLES
ncbi:MAG: DUF3854 domain-containing protein [Desmonostoc vinosum HA7617-LM4]|jgi:hypothetical protein|nr:DUF3854 domain-containing protein [Desmonostoc vinosum HA7617-LM4]